MTDRSRSIDLRAAARSLLAGERADPLALLPDAYSRIASIARSSSPVMADVEPAALGRSSSTIRAGGVAVLRLQGLITPQGSWLALLFGGSPGGLQGFRQELRQALGDPDVTGIVLDVHSPGGLIGLVPETAAELRAAREDGGKPIVAVANTMTASAAYWIAAQADELVITPSGFAGSIGVYVVHEDWSAFNEAFGVDPTYIYAGTYKIEGNADEPLGEEAKAAIQREVDDLYALFVADVAAGRRTSPQAVEDGYGQGRVLPARRAVAEGLGDRVATIDDVIRELGSRSANGDRARRASDPSPTIRDEGDNPGPNATRKLAEEVQARIAEVKAIPPVHI